MADDSVYLDHASTTPVRDEVLEAMAPYFGARFGNPSSMHRWGREARVALDEARERVAACIGAAPDELCFTSGGTEGDNLAVLGAWRARVDRDRRAVVVSAIEHKAVLAAAHQAAREGAEERVVPVDESGVIDDSELATALDHAVAVCSVMWVNNETGVEQPIGRIAALAAERGIPMHTDAVQAFGKVALDVRQTPVALLTISGHKFGAPKGIGAVYIRRGTRLEPLLHGGAQDRGRRAGTENVAAAIGLAVAAELAVQDREAEGDRLRRLRDQLEAVLLERVPDLVVHGRGAPRAPHITNVSIPGAESESMLIALDLRGIAASAGSACQSGSISPSHVLTAMGVRPDVASSALRLSFGSLSAPRCVARAAEVIPMLAAKARSVVARP